MASARQFALYRYVALKSDHIAAKVFWIVTFTILTAVGAQIEIPHQPVPFTLQTFFVLLAGGVLGWRNGFLSMSLYVLVGAAGLPVFSGGGFGPLRLLGPTGGYLLSFPIAAALVGTLLKFDSPIRTKSTGSAARLLYEYGRIVFAMSAGLLVIFLIGTFQLFVVYTHHWATAFQSGFLIFSAWDILKLCAAVAITREMRR